MCCFLFSFFSSSCVTLKTAAPNNEQTRVWLASRVGPLNGRKHSQQYLLCKQSSLGVIRPGVWVAQRHIQSERTKHKHTGGLFQAASPQPPFSPPRAITAKADRLDPPAVVFDLIVSSNPWFEMFYRHRHQVSISKLNGSRLLYDQK